MPKPDGDQFKLFNADRYASPSQRPTTYTDAAGRSRIATTDILPDWWKEELGGRVDPEYNSPHEIMGATRHIRGVDNDFVEIDNTWKGDDSSPVIWHGSPNRITDDKVSAASSVGQTQRYDAIDPESLKDFRQGQYHDADKVWGSSWRVAKDYAEGGKEGYMYGLDVTGDIDVNADGYAFDEDENRITQRYKLRGN